MALLEWKNEYSVGVDAVDHEHRELIDLINELHDAWLRGSDTTLEGFFGDLFKGISAHFALEEQFMREHRYDQLTAHKSDHERLLDEVRDIMDDATQTPATSAALAARLEAWFTHHFKTHDARLHKTFGPHPH